jgi:antitoxin component of RelBE/YafQ-DinJ toxin-antitoxin module
MRTTAPKTIQFSIRLDDAGAQRLRQLADHYGLGPVDTIRMLLKREADVLLPENGSCAAKKTT